MQCDTTWRARIQNQQGEFCTFSQRQPFWEGNKFFYQIPTVPGARPQNEHSSFKDSITVSSRLQAVLFACCDQFTLPIANNLRLQSYLRERLFWKNNKKWYVKAMPNIRHIYHAVNGIFFQMSQWIY